MGGSMIGIDSSGAILLEHLPEFIGTWTFTVYEGEAEWNDCGRVVNPILFSWSQRNLITTVGKALTLNRLFGLSAAVALTGTAVGTNSTAAAVGDTSITNAVFQAFDATPTLTGTTVTATTTYGTGTANINIQEAGLLTASGGVLFNHLAPVLGFTKTTAVSLGITTSVAQA